MNRNTKAVPARTLWMAVLSATDAKDFAALAVNPLPMPLLVLTGEKASGPFLIEQAKLAATDVTGVIVPGSGHWLMEESPQVVMKAIVAFVNGGM